MTQQESDDDILAKLAHVLRQRTRDAREWERQAGEWKAVADGQRVEIEAVTKERDEARTELARARDVVGSMVNQYMGYPEGYVSHEFMSAQEDAIEYLEDIGWLTGGALERYYWTPASGHAKEASDATT
jgi:hypothetical protein